MCDMDDLSDHLLLPIVTKVANSGIKNLFRFRATSLRYRRFLRSLEVLRDLPRSCLIYLFDLKPCAENIVFMKQLSDSGALNILYRFGFPTFPTTGSIRGGD